MDTQALLERLDYFVIILASVDAGSNLELTVEGLNVAFEKNIFKHLLEVNDGTFQGLKGQDFVSIPLVEKDR
jgi:hypothetical protein